MATRVKVGSNRKETLDQLYNITGSLNLGVHSVYAEKTIGHPVSGEH